MRFGKVVCLKCQATQEDLCDECAKCECLCRCDPAVVNRIDLPPGPTPSVDAGDSDLCDAEYVEDGEDPGDCLPSGDDEYEDDEDDECSVSTFRSAGFTGDNEYEADEDDE